jgi:hypothetical protein
MRFKRRVLLIVLASLFSTPTLPWTHGNGGGSGPSGTQQYTMLIL